MNEKIVQNAGRESLGEFAARDKRVQRQCSRPHDVAARLVIFGILYGNTARIYERLHKLLIYYDTKV